MHAADSSASGWRGQVLRALCSTGFRPVDAHSLEGCATSTDHGHEYLPVPPKTAASRHGCPLIALLLLLLNGCHPLPPGSLDQVRTVSNESRCTVYLIRGWRDVYSEGIDQLANELEQAHVNAPVFRASQWRELSIAIAHQHRDQARSDPLILLGFSYGADDVLRIAHELKPKDVSVELLVTIDPVTPPTVPANVKQCINYYQPNGVWDIFPWLRGIPLKADSATTRLLNQNLRSDRKDLLAPNTSHATIAANPKLHREIVQRILEVCRKHPSTLYTSGPDRDNAGR
jgi:hypothetical protein